MKKVLFREELVKGFLKELEIMQEKEGIDFLEVNVIKQDGFKIFEGEIEPYVTASISYVSGGNLKASYKIHMGFKKEDFKYNLNVSHCVDEDYCILEDNQEIIKVINSFLSKYNS